MKARKETYEELVTEVKRLKEENEKLRNENSVLSPIPKDIKFSDLVDIGEVRELLEHFYKLTGFAIGLVDVSGKVLIAIGWQKICNNFHRKHPDTRRNCQESVSFIQNNLVPKKITTYKCKNGLWDIAYPIIIGGKHLANVFFGQFFYENEEIDIYFFEKQAEMYGFDKNEYLQGLKEIPVISRKKVESIIGFYAGLAENLAKTGYANYILKKQKSKELRKAEEQLKQNKRFLDNIIDHLPLGLQVFDKDGFSTRVNYARKELLGLPDLDKGIGKFNVLTDPYSVANGADKVYRKVYDHSEIINREFEYDFNLAENEWDTRHDKRFFHETIFPIQNENNEVTHTVALLTDITRRKTIERELKESESRFRSIFDNAISGIAFTNGKGKLLLVNKAFEELIGYSKEELLKMDFAGFTHPDDIDVEKRLIRQNLVKNKYQQRWEKRYIRKDNTIIWVDISVSIIRNEAGEPEYFVGVVNDITDKKRVEIDLRKSEKKYRSVVASMNEGVIMQDSDRKLIAINAAVERILGIPGHELTKEIIFSHHWQVIDEKGNNFPECKNPVNVAFQTGKSQKKVIIGLKRPKKEVCWLNINAVPIFNSDKTKPIAVVVTFMDVTYQKDTENELKEINAAKDRLFSIIAHDLKNPFNAILGFSEMLVSENLKDKSDIYKYIKQIYDGARRSYDLLNNLLEWSRAQTRHIEFRPAFWFAEELIDEAIGILANYAHSKGVEMIKAIEPYLKLKADKNMLNTILRNLLSNAIKYSKAGGKLIISAVRIEGYVEFSVSDNGVGIDRDKIETVFRTEKIDTAPGTNNEKGSGLGLLICKEFITRHNGEIWIKSIKSKGTTVYFRIPCGDKPLHQQ